MERNEALLRFCRDCAGETENIGDFADAVCGSCGITDENGRNLLQNTQITGKKLYEEDFDSVRVWATDETARYGAPITKAVRVWVMKSPNRLFAADIVCAEVPVHLQSRFALREESGLNIHEATPTRIVFRRDGKGLKLFVPQAVSDGAEEAPMLLRETGDGEQIYGWRSIHAAREQIRVHTLIASDSERIVYYHVAENAEHAAHYEMPDYAPGFVRIEGLTHEDWFDLKAEADAFTVRLPNGVRRFTV